MKNQAKKNTKNQERKSAPAAVVAAGNSKIAKHLEREQNWVNFRTGTRHNGVTPSLATLTRAPLALPTKVTKVTKPKADTKTSFVAGLLRAAADTGMTWEQIRSQLIAKYGSAPKKRRSLYLLLDTIPHSRTTGTKGIVTYRIK